MSAEEKKAAFPVRLIDIPERQVAYIRVTNAFAMEKVLAALKTVIEWAKSQDIFSQGTLFGMTVDDPHVTPARLYRYEVCLASSLPFQCMKGMSKLKIPAMRYAAIKVSGDLDKVEVLKVLGMVNAVPEFTDQPKVINGCSDLFVAVLGERGRHARSAVGMGSLPNQITVEIEAVMRVVS